MKKRRILLIICLVLLSSLLSACVDSYKKDEAVAVIEDHFKYYNEKDGDRLLSTLTEDLRKVNWVWKFYNLAKVEVLSIEHVDDNKLRDEYMTQGRGNVNKASKNNILVYNVEFYQEYIDDSISVMPSGTYTFMYFLIRDDKNSPWLIDDWGY